MLEWRFTKILSGKYSSFLLSTVFVHIFASALTLLLSSTLTIAKFSSNPLRFFLCKLLTNCKKAIDTIFPFFRFLQFFLQALVPVFINFPSVFHLFSEAIRFLHQKFSFRTDILSLSPQSLFIFS